MKSKLSFYSIIVVLSLIFSTALYAESGISNSVWQKIDAGLWVDQGLELTKIEKIDNQIHIYGSSPSYLVIDKAKRGLRKQGFNKVRDKSSGSIERRKLFHFILELEKLEARASSPISKSALSIKPNYTVAQNELTSYLESRKSIMTHSTGVPYLKDGSCVSYRLFDIYPGSLFDRIGIDNGDSIISYNNVSGCSIRHPVELLESLQENKSLALLLNRKDKELLLSVAVSEHSKLRLPTSKTIRSRDIAKDEALQIKVFGNRSKVNTNNP